MKGLVASTAWNDSFFHCILLQLTARVQHCDARVVVCGGKALRGDNWPAEVRDGVCARDEVLLDVSVAEEAFRGFVISHIVVVIRALSFRDISKIQLAIVRIHIVHISRVLFVVRVDAGSDIQHFWLRLQTWVHFRNVYVELKLPAAMTARRALGACMVYRAFRPSALDLAWTVAICAELQVQILRGLVIAHLVAVFGNRAQQLTLSALHLSFLEHDVRPESNVRKTAKLS